MLTSNLNTSWGLYNGAMGTVRDIYFKPGRQPNRAGSALPDAVFVEFPKYVGPEIVAGQPCVVPIGPWLWEEHCSHHGCSRFQVPLRMCWAITCHKSQGMTIGPGQMCSRAIVNLGNSSTEDWASGAAFVQLSAYGLGLMKEGLIYLFKG